MPGPHDKIIAETAKAVLSPLGFRRQGRSRLWLADQRWWLGVVEFQPSAWSKGCYLNVAAHWLWSESDDISLDHGGRIGSFEEYKSDAQFTKSVANLADQAGHEAHRFVEMFASTAETAKILLAAERVPTIRFGGHWPAFNAGVAAGLNGQMDDANEMFAAVLSKPWPTDSVLHRSAEKMAKLLAEPARFRAECETTVAKRRDVLGMPILDDRVF